jgi:hypothetical protein
MGSNPVVLYQTVYTDVANYVVDGFSVSNTVGLSYKQFASSYLLHSIIRKWIPKDSKLADAAALTAFTDANERCKVWSFEPEWEIDRVVFGEVQKILDDFFHPCSSPLISSYFDLLGRGKPGPGVNVNAIGTSYYTKYLASPLSTTSLYLYEEYKRYCEWIPFLSDAECHRYESYGPPTIVSGSRCSFVPKTSATSRMICIEPSLNMFYQLGLASILEARLKTYFSIDLSSQPQVNHSLGCLGSKDDSLCTIDLSSASDSISLSLCEALLPKWFFELLLTLRSHTAEINGIKHPLFMVSTMGNGFTFPLQTIIFAAISKAITTVYCRGDRRRFSVFGDDIICETYLSHNLIRFLRLLNFRINPSKTFSEGPFRESCGADWFYGQPVRPVFCKKLDSPFDFLITINQLNEWSSYTGIPLRNTLNYLVSQLSPKFRNFVPFDSSFDSGIRVPLALLDRKSFDKNLSFLYKSWERRSSRIRILEGSIRTPSGFGKMVIYNPSGLYCSFLFGELRSLSIMVRHNRKIYRQKLRCIPYWDYIPSGSLTNGVRLSWQQWETAVVINLTKT